MERRYAAWLLMVISKHQLLMGHLYRLRVPSHMHASLSRMA